MSTDSSVGSKLIFRSCWRAASTWGSRRSAGRIVIGSSRPRTSPTAMEVKLAESLLPAEPELAPRWSVAAERMQSPAEVLTLLNRHVYNSTPPEKYATLFLGLYDGEAQTFTYSNGGHLPPFLIHRSGVVRKLETGGLVIGLFPEIVLEEEKVRLAPGDIFVAFSDGITEPENEFGEFGEERLLELVRSNRHLTLDRISEIVIAAVQDWIGENEQPDDVTLVLARVR